jgi:5-methyltetrahydropteroyltriglutamate--homocysteine methyltransferase
MRYSADRILTTHVGSLPRPQEVVDVLFAQDRGEGSEQEFEDTVRRAVADVVTKQLEVGIDVPSDGEMSKINYATYMRHRLSGFDRFSEAPRAHPADLTDFPEYLEQQVESGARPVFKRPVCTGPISHRDLGPMRRDLERLRAATEGHDGDAFLNAASPGVVAAFQPNEYYPSHEAYLEAIVPAMAPEYEAVVQAGFVLQVDCPDMAMVRHMNFRNETDDGFLKIVDLHVEALNEALRNVPADSVRMHVCWGNYEGPHLWDIPLAKVARAVLRAKPQALLVEAANPRHGHEWVVWREIGLPDDKILVPGVIDTTTNFVEHPELVAQRICTFADVVGKERVIAGTDCGFGTFVGMSTVAPRVAVAKLEALAEGARLVSQELY